jgi:hypothetical protein
MPYDDTLIVSFMRESHAPSILTDREKHLIGRAAAVNAGVTAATAREGFRMADAAAEETCTNLCAADGGRN